VDGDDEAAADEYVHLDRLDMLVAPARSVEDDERVLAIVVELRPLAEPARVLQRERMQPEQLPELGDLRVGGALQLEPEVLVALEQRLDLAAIDRGQDPHGCPS